VKIGEEDGGGYGPPRMAVVEGGGYQRTWVLPKNSLFARQIE